MEEQKGRFSLGLFSSGKIVGPGNDYLARLQCRTYRRAALCVEHRQAIYTILTPFCNHSQFIQVKANYKRKISFLFHNYFLFILLISRWLRWNSPCPEQRGTTSGKLLFCSSMANPAVLHTNSWTSETNAFWMTTCAECPAMNSLLRSEAAEQRGRDQRSLYSVAAQGLLWS